MPKVERDLRRVRRVQFLKARPEGADGYSSANEYQLQKSVDKLIGESADDPGLLVRWNF